jgi:ABC-type sugar transport system ATPase subunit
MSDPVTILRTSSLTKKYGDTAVLRDVDFEVLRGECHAVVGENGAGKTTLMNILGGIVRPSSGSFNFYGRDYQRVAPRESIDIGISVIHQDFALVPTLSVSENIFLSRLKRTARGMIINKRKLDRDAKEILGRLGEADTVKPGDLVGGLSTSKQQIVEIAKALAEGPRLLIMDEPTTSLTKSEVKNLFRIINGIKKDGISIIYVSHILEEVFEISDRITVLRDGELVGTHRIVDVTVMDVISMMVGHKVDLYGVKQAAEAVSEAPIALSVEELSVDGVLKNVSFKVRRGEILGFAGLIGSGRSEVARAVFGVYPRIRGRIFLEGKEVRIRSPLHAMRLGLGFLPEDRRLQGYVPTMSVMHNMSLAAIRSLAPAGIPNARRERALVNRYVSSLKIRTGSISSPITSLSGGNQQKVLMCKWLATRSRVLIVDEPTQGIDVGSKSEIHKILRDLAKENVAILLISSELPEIMTLCDRIVVMRQGTKSGELTIEEATQEKIMYLATVGAQGATPSSPGRAESRV